MSKEDSTENNSPNEFWDLTEYSEIIKVRVPDAIKLKFRIQCETHGTNMSAYLRNFIMYMLEHENEFQEYQ